MNTEIMLDRLRAANPVPPGGEPVDDALLLAVHERSATMATSTERRATRGIPDLTDPDRKPRRPAWIVAAAAFAVVVVLGAVLIGLTRDTGTVEPATTIPATTAPVPPPADDALATIESFAAAVNAGDVGGAMAHVHPEAVVPLGVNNLAGWIAFTSQFDGTMEILCTAGSAASEATCDWSWSTAGTDATGVAGLDDAIIAVEDQVIVRISRLPNYGEFEAPLVRYARNTDPGGFDAACSDPGASVMAIGGWALTESCGAFVAGYEVAFIAQLSG